MKGTETKKSKIVNFVKTAPNGMRRKDIIRFVVDMNYDEGTYDKDPYRWRGYYSSAFSETVHYNKFLSKHIRAGWLLTGTPRLVNIGRGLYKAILTDDRVYEGKYSEYSNLCNFPPALVDLMIQRTKDAGNDCSLDEINKTPGAAFVWDKTPEGHDFWAGVILHNDFGMYEFFPTNSDKTEFDPLRFIKYVPPSEHVINIEVSPNAVNVIDEFDFVKSLISKVKHDNNNQGDGSLVFVSDDNVTWIKRILYRIDFNHDAPYFCWNVITADAININTPIHRFKFMKPRVEITKSDIAKMLCINVDELDIICL
jgi:hypothetical protein